MRLPVEDSELHKLDVLDSIKHTAHSEAPKTQMAQEYYPL